MKNYFSAFAVLFAVIVAGQTFAQESCKVLVKEISEKYSGGCKNGLANGKGIAEGTDRYEGQFRKGYPDGNGTYTWSTGEVYSGQWKAGKRNGTGTYTYLENGKDSVKYGRWLDDNYAGPVYAKPYVKNKEGIDRYSFQKNGGQRNRVLLNIYQNGVRNTEINNLLMSTSSGYDTNLGPSFGYDAVTFPVTIRITYTTFNKLHTMPLNVKFEFVIYEPGDWVVDIHN